MSLILDALRKADAERERGSVPGLRSQPVVPLSEAAAAAKRPVRLGWPSIAIGIGVGLALAATWVMVGRNTQDRDAAPATARSAPGATTGQAIATGDPLPPTALSPVASAPPTPAATMDAARQDIAEPAPWTRPGERSAGAPGAAEGAQPRPASASADAPIYPQDLLPSQVRAALPPLAISGSIYSPDPAGRSLIVNGRLLRERDKLSQDLALEEIRLKSAIFVFRGYRFEVLF